MIIISQRRQGGKECILRVFRYSYLIYFKYAVCLSSRSIRNSSFIFWLLAFGISLSPSHFALPGKIGPVQLFYYASYYSRTQKDSKDGHQLYYINDTHPYFDSSIILLPFLLVKFFSLINLDQIHSLIFWRSVPSFLKLFL